MRFDTFTRNKNAATHRRSAAVRWLAAFVLLLVAHNCMAKTWMVGVGFGCNYSKIQDAISASAPGDTIVLTTSADYSKDQHILLDNRTLTISGLYQPGCVTIIIPPPGPIGEAATAAARVTVSGSGTIRKPVFSITGTSHITLQNLTISDAVIDGNGGGIAFNGNGTVGLQNVEVFGNTADSGGGVAAKSVGGRAVLVFANDTVVSSNIARNNGGGVRVEGDVYFQMESPNSWIGWNYANAIGTEEIAQKKGVGGGLLIVGTDINHRTDAYIGAPGVAIFNNTANYGGGIAAADAGASLWVYSTDALHPTTIGPNTARRTGGGIFQRDWAVSCLADIRIDNNIAQEGTAIYLDVGTDDDIFTYMAWNDFGGSDYCKFSESTVPKVACDSSVACNTVHSNVAENVLTTPVAKTDGAAILIQSGNGFAAQNLDIRANEGGYALWALGYTSDSFDTEVALTNCLMADNKLNHEVIKTSDGAAHLYLANCTLAHNALGAAQVIAANDVLGIRNSIIDNGSSVAALNFSGSGSNLNAQYNVSGNVTGLGTNPTNSQAEPIYMNLAHGDYRLVYSKVGSTLTKSPGLDFAPSGGGADIRAMARDIDLSGITNLYGARDVGAYEMQPITGRIFADGFGDPVLLVY